MSLAWEKIENEKEKSQAKEEEARRWREIGSGSARVETWKNAAQAH